MALLVLNYGQNTKSSLDCDLLVDQKHRARVFGALAARTATATPQRRKHKTFDPGSACSPNSVPKDRIFETHIPTMQHFTAWLHSLAKDFGLFVISCRQPCTSSSNV